MTNLFAGMLLNTEASTKVVLKLPNGTTLKDVDGKEAYICVLSTDSKKATALRQASRDKRLAGEKSSAAQIDEDANDVLAQLTTDWYLVALDGKPIVGEDQKPLPCTTDNAKVLYSLLSASHWTDQVKIASGMRENFMPAPASA